MITAAQIERIKSKISQVLDRKREPLQEINNDIDEDYAKGRYEQEITKLVYNEFQPDNQDIEGLVITKRKYGHDMTLTELHCDESVYQVYNHTAQPYSTEEVKRQVLDHGNTFHILEFTIISGSYELKKLEIVSFDGINSNGRATIRSRETVWPV